MNQLLLLLWLDQQSREARILRRGARQDWEITTEPIPVSENLQVSEAHRLICLYGASEPKVL
jgi:hypothetical protein